MDILKTIIQETIERVNRSNVSAPVGSLELLPAFRAPTLSLRSCLDARRMGVIAEIKRASPSRGVIRQDFDVPAIARSFRAAGATAISVLTEPNHFEGSLADLATVRMVVDLPILRKDFVVDPYQLVEARAWGADAVLLIAAALDREQIAELMSTADELRLECLVEVHDPVELDKLDFDRVKLLGVNNRDLKTLRVDIRQTTNVLDLVPTDVTVISESGIRTAAEIVELSRRGAAGFLIGTALMKSRDPGDALRALIDQSETMMRSPRPLRVAV